MQTHQYNPPVSIVYIHVQILCGGIESHYHPPTSQYSIFCAHVLGNCATAYLVAHGYTVTSIAKSGPRTTQRLAT